MQATINLDNSLMETAFQLTGLKTEQDVCEKAVKELVKNYQNTAIKKSWLGCMRHEGKIIGDIVSPILDESDWEVLSQ